MFLPNRAALLGLVAISYSTLTAIVSGEEIPSKMTSHDVPQHLVIGHRPDGMLPFPIACSKVGEVFRWMPLAIVVQKVECDGKEVLPFSRRVMMDNFDSGLVEVRPGSVTYLSALRPLVSVQKYNATTGDYEACGYNVPAEFKKLTILYAHRSPDGGALSQQQELRVIVE